MKSKLYVSDLDYTLMRKDQTISQHTKDILNRLYDNNILFTVASARNSRSMIPKLEGIKLHLPIIEFNGGFITDPVTRKRLVTNSINSKFVDKLWSLSNEFHLSPIISVTTETQDYAYYLPKNLSSGIKGYIENRKKKENNWLAEMDSFEEIRNNKIMAFTFIGKRADLLPLRDRIDTYSDFVNYYFYENEYTPGYYWLTIHDIKSSKESALNQLRNMYKLDESELIVFGDNVNDIGMFKIADRGYAVNNATPELKKIATKIIDSHESDSVADFILKENNLISN